MGRENKTNCDLFHCEVQGRGLCNSNLKVQHKDTVTRLPNFQPSLLWKAVPQPAGGTIPCFFQE